MSPQIRSMMGENHLSVREPANPRVLALHYRVANNDDLIYRTAERSVHRRDGFDVVMDDGRVVFEFHDHYPSEELGRAGVRDFIDEWEFQADLAIGARKFRLEFVRAVKGRDRGSASCASVSHWSPSDKIFTARGDQAIIPQNRGPVDCRPPLLEPESKGLASHSRPTVTLNLPGAGTGHLGGHQRRVSFACGVWLCCLNWVIGFLRGLPYSQRGWVF